MSNHTITVSNQTLTGFEEFCGGVFWDTSLTWYTSPPDLTPCFQLTVLGWGPCAWLWLILPMYASYLSHCHGPSVQPNKLNRWKTFLSVLLACVAATDLVKGLYDWTRPQPTIPMILMVSPAVLIATMLLTVIYMQVERKKGFITSGVLFLFWFLSFVAGVLVFYSKALNAVNGIDDLFRFITFFIYFALVVIQLVLSCISDKLPYEQVRHQGKEPCPEVTASFLARITFWWLNGLVLTGYRKPLEEKDLWSLNPRDLSDTTYPRFAKAWRKQLKKVGWFDDQHKKRRQMVRAMSHADGSLRSDALSHNAAHIDTSERTPLLSDGHKSKSLSHYTDGHAEVITKSGKKKEKKKKEPSLFAALAKVYGPTLLTAHCCKLVCDLLTFVGPLLQSQLIEYTENDKALVWKGYFYAFLFFVSSVLNSFFFHQLFHIGMTLGMRVKAALIAAVYEKALSMSNEARKTSTVGEIVNLMSVDAQRMQDVTGYLWMLWSAPLQIVLAVYMLWGILGPSVLAGLGVMVLLIPVNGFMASVQRKLQIKFMAKKDARIKLMNEVLNGMKVLKLYAWELSFMDKITEIRREELQTLKKYSYLGAIGTFTWTCAPFLVTLATFAAYTLSGGILDAQKAFTSLSLFNILRFPMNLLPMMVTYLVTASVSVKRLGKFLRNGDIDTSCVKHDPRATDPIVVENGTFSWGTGEDDNPILKNISLRIPDGKLVAVVGQVGSGKSSLISACLGEMEKLQGLVNLRGSVAYVAQQAWIQNASLKDNILFGKDLDQDKYDSILDACALRTDLDILPGGDQTEIGEKGINLSGGQKQRVSLARSVYQDADIYLMDDPLSAVDSHVGKHIFEQVMSDTGILKGKTRVLVTHGVQWLPKVDQIIVLVNGEMTEVGSYEELLSHDGDFAQFLKTYLTKQESDDESEDPEIEELKATMLERVTSVAHDDEATERKTHGSGGSEKDSSHSNVRRRKSGSGSKSPSVDRQKSKTTSRQKSEMTKITEKPDDKKGEKLIEDEKREEGRVKFAVFVAYCQSLGGWYTLGLLFFFLCYQGASVGSNLWLSEWTDDPLTQNAALANTSDFIHARDMYLGVYGALGGIQAIFVLLFAILTAISMVRASAIMHFNMLSNIVRSPMSFFDTTPIGRILNRFSRDIETIDTILPSLIRSFLNTFFTVISTIVVITYSTPIFLSVVVPLGLLYYFIQRFYIPTSRQLKRVESTTRSPIYVHFSETVTGASTIRAFRAQDRFCTHSKELVDHNLVFYFASIASNRWLGFRLEFVGACVVVAAALFAVVGKSSGISPGLVGLSISYALQVTSSLNWMVRMTTDLETNIVSVERVKEYSETPTEAEWYIDDTKPPAAWPRDGNVAFVSYATRYRPELDLVLRGISVNINAGESVGIVGRTGAGKSSLTLALFRIIEAAQGRITIDGVDVSRLGLHQLRSKLTILPQDPVLFSGSLRMNLDPFDKFTDEEIWQALEHAHLKAFVKSLAAGLEYEVGEGGQNLSVGQRQLVCLGRTLLRKTKILILDEATAAVDLETDELIQKTIRTEFADCTVITIAHRLNTILDNDRVMVLSAGKIEEFDTPRNLLENKKSSFFSMAKDAGLAS